MDNNNIEHANDELQQAQSNGDVEEHAPVIAPEIEPRQILSSSNSGRMRENNRHVMPFNLREANMVPRRHVILRMVVDSHCAMPSNTSYRGGVVPIDLDVMRPVSDVSSTEAMAALEQFFFVANENNNEDYCIICREEYEDGSHLCILPCNHIYHHQCIQLWLQNNNTCPYCSSEITLTTCPYGSREITPRNL